ncbi:peptidase M14 [Kribbella qitaiheensis]|uniref:Peptidase M14 n=1 Tax=Kribbella qitaiheensis TaxID=1544730 RepID=A0A7G6X7N8_9ACTN|nr:M14 family zinc carboxypeptidase [Kribbella qitaiheensis]QNE22253.1 peptidase M14 [Kribbella qitaiheensis]
MRRIATSLAGLAAVAVAVAGFAPGSSAAPAPEPVAQADSSPAYYTLKLPAGLTIAQLVKDGYDISHGHGTRPIVVATPAEAKSLRDRGVLLGKSGSVYQPLVRRADATGTTYYGGYHTVVGHEQHNAAVASAHPNLVKLYDIGDSWKKTKGQGGHDIHALCITKLTTGDCALNSTGKKPKFVLHTQIHARELSTGELAYRWIDLLVTSYGKDPAITSLVDSRELWVVPMANPDGVDVVLTLHSFGNDILAPYGYTNTNAPDKAALVALGKKMSGFNGYSVTTGDGGVGYFAPGATDDWLYGTRGVPSYTFEVGPDSGSCGGFFPAYSCMDSTFWPKNKGAFLYAAQAAATPYGTLP